MYKELLAGFKPLDIKELRYPGFVNKLEEEDKISFENVKKGKGWQSPNQNCPLCGCVGGKKIFGTFDLFYIACPDCGCAYVEKFPVDPSDIYSDEEYEQIAASSYLDNVDYRKERFGVERINLVKNNIKKNPNDAKLLDVGCGTGWFLDVAKENGFNVCGIEFGEHLAKATEKRLGIKVYTEALSSFEKTEVFDIITMFDVIEHVKDPRKLLESMYDHLVSGGIGVLFTPNLDSFAIQTLKEHSSLVCPCDHTFLFNEKSLRKTGEQIGFEVIYSATKGSDIIDIYAYYDQFLEQHETAQFLKDNADGLQAMIDEAKCGNHLRLILKK
jgi:2-polyprenyl-3-methyl-5-hydroxy-6-metoxy-1,4-benzoquinol methylase